METAVPISSSLCRRLVQDAFTRRGLCTNLNRAFLMVQGLQGWCIQPDMKEMLELHCTPVPSVSTCFLPFMCPRAVKYKCQECLYQNTDSVWLFWLWDEVTAQSWSFFTPHHQHMWSIHELRSILYIFPFYLLDEEPCPECKGAFGPVLLCKCQPGREEPEWRQGHVRNK